MDKAFLDAVLETDGDRYAKQKDAAGRFSTFAWIGASLFAIWLTPGASFLSWQAAVLVIVGMFVAAVVFGWLIYGAERIVTKVIMRLLQKPTPAVVKMISAVGILLPIAAVYVMYLCAAWILGLIL